MDTTPTAVSLLVGSIFIFVLTIRGMTAPIFDRTTEGAPDGYTRGDKSGLFAACAAVVVVAPFSYWAAPKLASILTETDVLPDAATSVIGYGMAAVAALSVVTGLYIKYVWDDPHAYPGVNEGAKTVRSIAYTFVGALAGCFAAAVLAA